MRTPPGAGPGIEYCSERSITWDTYGKYPDKWGWSLTFHPFGTKKTSLILKKFLWRDINMYPDSEDEWIIKKH